MLAPRNSFPRRGVISPHPPGPPFVSGAFRQLRGRIQAASRLSQQGHGWHNAWARTGNWAVPGLSRAQHESLVRADEKPLSPGVPMGLACCGGVVGLACCGGVVGLVQNWGPVVSRCPMSRPTLSTPKILVSAYCRLEQEARTQGSLSHQG